jgi:branched-subunit amino acid aminotransferase/4-amino-4-deoxychorismate lyase
MALNTYICLNGDYLKATEPSLFPHNRALRYGDSLSECLHAYATEPQFLGYHLERLFENMRFLTMEVPAYFTVQNFNQITTRLLNKNRIFGGARVRLTVYRESINNFDPGSAGISFILESEKLIDDQYELNERGYFVDICKDYTKACSSFSHIRNANPLLYLVTDFCKSQKNLDALILLNEAGRLVETTNSNVFLVSGNAVFTPAIHQGCIPGIMRRIVIDLAMEGGFRVNDQSSLTPASLLEAEEVFLTNAVEGIRWVGAYQQKRYYKKTAKALTLKLNELAFK